MNGIHAWALATRHLFRVMVLATVAGLAGCGGGGGGGPSSTLSLSTNHVTASATTDDVAPTASLQATLSNPPDSGVYVGYTTTGPAVSSVDFVDNGPTSATVLIHLEPPAQLGVGTYTDTITLYVCYDEYCNSPVGNSPQAVSVEYHVTAGQNPLPGTPALSALSPSSTNAGGLGFTLTISGEGFLPQSVVQWNGVARPTQYDSPTQVTAQISAADIAQPGTVGVTVSNAATGGGTSVAFSFTVLPPAALSLTRISPTAVEAGGPGFVLTAIGTGFTASSIVQWNGAARPTTFVSSTELTAQIPASDIAQVGSAAVTVFNPGGLGTVSGAMNLTINPHSIDAVAFQIDPNHSGAVQFKSASLPAASRWQVDLGGAASYALIAAGKVFVTVSMAGGSSQLIALDQATGATVWGPIVISGAANAAYDAGTVFVVTTGGLMQAFDGTTGQSKWSTVLVGQYSFSSPPTAAHGLVFTGGAGTGGTLYAVEQGTGTIVWTRPVANGDSSAPAVSSDGVFVTYPCSTYAFRPANGESTWSNNTGCSGGGGATPVVANGVLYSPNGMGGSYSGSVFNAATGALLGAYVADNPPAIGASSGYFLQGGTLRRVDLSSYSVQWSFAGDGQLVTSPILVNEYVFIGSAAGHLYAVEATTGQQVWVQDLGAALPEGARWGTRMPFTGLAAGDGLLVVPAGTKVTAFTLSTSP